MSPRGADRDGVEAALAEVARSAARVVAPAAGGDDLVAVAWLEGADLHRHWAATGATVEDVEVSRLASLLERREGGRPLMVLGAGGDAVHHGGVRLGARAQRRVAAARLHPGPGVSGWLVVGARRPEPFPHEVLGRFEALARAGSYRLATWEPAGGPAPNLPALPGAVEAHVVLDPDLHVRSWDAGAESLYGYTADEALGRPVDELMTTLLPAGDRATLGAVFLDAGWWAGELVQRDRSGRPFLAEVSARLRRDGDGLPGEVVAHVRAPDPSELVFRTQAFVLEQLAGDLPLGRVLDTVCAGVERAIPGTACAVLLVTASGTALRTVSAPSLPAGYVRALGEVPVAPGAGSCGMAAHTGERVVVTDTAADPRWAQYRHLAAEQGLRACWSVPIHAGVPRRVVGTFALYFREPRTPTDDESFLVSGFVDLAAVAIGHHRDDGTVADDTAASRNAASGNAAGTAASGTAARDAATVGVVAGGDQLTGLPGRTLLVEHLDALLASPRDASAVALMSIDLDDFREVNDELGHAAGDELIVETASRLLRTCRAGDLVARIGADEFMVLCPAVAGEIEAAGLADQVVEALRQPLRCGGTEVFPTPSVGVALADPDGAPGHPDVLVRRAMAAMAEVKQEGGNGARLRVADPGAPRGRRRVETLAGLHRALERGELSVHYQPRIRLPEGSVRGLEALVRWRRPGEGHVAPDQFVPLAERTGLIGPIGAFVLDRALADLASWHRDGFLVEVSINLSSRQLDDPGFVGAVRERLAAHDVPPELVTFELTETALMRDPESVADALADLKSLGVRLAVDDFGTGYSSLAYLTRFPVDELKIDRTFVAALDDDTDSAAIVRAVVGLARSLDLRCVAEGVERPRQRARLEALHCDEAQGFLLGRPQAAAGTTEVLRRAVTGPGIG